MKSKLALLLALFTVVLLLPACQDRDGVQTGSLELVFKGTFGEDPLYMFARSYDYRGDAEVKWQTFQFYLSDLEILSGTRIEMLSPVESVSFSGMQSESEALAGYVLRFDDLPTGIYTGFRFGLGVSPELNATQPSDYAATEPLAQVSNYWEAAASYIFTKIEGNADLDGDGQFGEEPEKLTYHLGASELFEKRTLPVNFEIRPSGTTRLTVNVDLLKALEDTQTGSFIDFRQTPRDHHKNPDVYNFVIKHLRESAINLGN